MRHRRIHSILEGEKHFGKFKESVVCVKIKGENEYNRLCGNIQEVIDFYLGK